MNICSIFSHPLIDGILFIPLFAQRMQLSGALVSPALIDAAGFRLAPTLISRLPAKC
jgi:hypothetical protein